MIRQRVIYKGNVQGVGFRATTNAIARGFAVTGFVRNEPDGSVLCEVQGEPGEVAEFQAKVRLELSRRISQESREDAAIVSSEGSFSIRY